MVNSRLADGVGRDQLIEYFGQHHIDSSTWDLARHRVVADYTFKISDEPGRKRFEAVTPKLQTFHATQWVNLTHAEVQELHRLLAKALWGSAGEPAGP